MNDDFLKKYYQPPRRQFAADLYQRISTPMKTKRVLNTRQIGLAFAVVLAMLVVTLAVSPPARAFARQLFRQIGVFTITEIDEARTEVDPTLQMPTTEPPTADVVETADSPEAASELAGFSIYASLELPEGYTQTGGWSLMDQSSGKVVVSKYVDSEGHFLLFNQYRYGEGDSFEQTISPNEQVTDVTVRGQPGVWIEGRLMGDSPDTLVPTVWLMWEEDGINYTLFADVLSQEPMLAVAESLD